MRRPLPITHGRVAGVAIAVLALASLAACGSKSTTFTAAPSSSSAAGGSTTVCGAVAGSALVTLADDKHLQSSDDIVPVVRTAVAKAPLTTALNAVSAALTQAKLNALNVDTDVNRESSEQAASAFVSANGLGTGFTGGSGTIRVVAANFSENLTLAWVYADVLKDAGYTTKVDQSTNRELYLPALEKGDYDVVPEYAATLTEFFNTAENGANATPKASSEIATTMVALRSFATAKGLTALNAASATDENAFAVTKNFATKYGVTTLSGLATACGGGISLGGPPECTTRSYCELGLKDTYGLKITKFTSLDAGGSLSKNALKQGTVALALVFSSDSSVTPAT